MVSTHLFTSPQSTSSKSEINPDHHSNQLNRMNYSNPSTHSIHQQQQYLQVTTPITPITPTTPDSSNLVLPADHHQHSLDNYLTQLQPQLVYQSTIQPNNINQQSPHLSRKRRRSNLSYSYHDMSNDNTSNPSTYVNFQQSYNPTSYHSIPSQIITPPLYSNTPITVQQNHHVSTKPIQNQVVQRKQKSRKTNGGVNKGAATGLKSFAQCVANKLRIIGNAPYTTIADELVSDAINKFQRDGESYNEAEVDKNVRRRVYDALNVFCAVGMVLRCGKQVEWRGTAHLFRVEKNKPETECMCDGKLERKSFDIDQQCDCQGTVLKKLRNKVDLIKRQIMEKRERLKELRHEQICVQQIVRRNAARDDQRLTTGSDVLVSDDLEFVRPDPNRVDLPFIMVSTAHTTDVAIHMENSREQVSLQFDSKFRIHDGFSVVRQVCERDSQISTRHELQNSCSNVKEEVNPIAHEAGASPVSNVVGENQFGVTTAPVRVTASERESISNRVF